MNQESPTSTHPAPAECPVCRGALQPRRLGCDGCGTEVSGRFHQPPPWGLGEEQLDFLRGFLARRGDLAATARDAGHEPAWAHRQLDAVLDAMGAESPAAAGQPSDPPRDGAGQTRPQRTADQPPPPTRDEVLALVAQGRMDPADAAVLLGQR